LSEISIYLEKQLFYYRALSPAYKLTRQISGLGPLMASMHDGFTTCLYSNFGHSGSCTLLVHTAPAALVKTAQQSGYSGGKVAFHHSIFCQGVSSFISFANEVTNF